MFKGTEKNPGDAFSQTVADIGGQENAFTSSDYTGFFQRVPREHLKEMMALEADRITGLVLTDDVVRPELKVVLEEQNMRVANNPSGRLGEQMDAALYLNHPYGRPVIGWRQEIEKLDRDEALAFYRRFYTPNNAIVVVAGDVTAGRGQGASPRKPTARSRRATEIGPRVRPEGAGAGSAAHRHARRSARRAAERQPLLSRRRPSTTAKPGESEALDVLAHVARPRLQQPALPHAGGRQGHRAQCRRLLFEHRARLRQVRRLRLAEAGHDAAAMSRAAIDAVLADVIDNGVTADELDRAKNRLIADAVYAQDNQATLARWYGAALRPARPSNMVRSWPDRIRAVTADAVREAARRWLDRRWSVTGYLVKSLQPEEKRS